MRQSGSFYRKFSYSNPIALFMLGALFMLAANLLGSKAVAFLGILIIVTGVFLIGNLALKRGRRRPLSAWQRRKQSAYCGRQYGRNRTVAYRHKPQYTNRAHRNDTVADYVIAPRRQTEGLSQPAMVRQPEAERMRATDRVVCSEGTSKTRTVDREYAYFQMLLDRTVYNLADMQRVRQLVNADKFKDFYRFRLEHIIDDQIEYNTLFSRVNGYVIPRNYVTKAFRTQDGMGMNLVLFNGEKAVLHFKKNLSERELENSILYLGELYPDMEYLESGGSDWYVKNARKMFKQAVWESKGADYDGIDRIIAGWDMEHLLGKVGYDRRPPSEESYDKYNNVIECRAFGK